MTDHFNVYIGERIDNECIVTVNGQPLDMCIKVSNHASEPNWGYGGSGVAQLALALLVNEFSIEYALRNYQKFKWEVLAPMKLDRWSFTSGDIKRLCKAHHLV
jgi:hypothetical protein